MALSYKNAKFQGTKTVIDKLRKFGSIGENRIKVISKAAALDIANDAKNTIIGYPDPVGSQIAQSIAAVPSNEELTWTVIVGVEPMSAYIEFGTGRFVEIPPGWEKIAWHYYVNGKGYLRPYPYLYPAYYKGRRQYKKDLKDSLNYLIDRFNSNSI